MHHAFFDFNFTKLSYLKIDNRIQIFFFSPKHSYVLQTELFLTNYIFPLLLLTNLVFNIQINLIFSVFLE